MYVCHQVKIYNAKNSTSDIVAPIVQTVKEIFAFFHIFHFIRFFFFRSNYSSARRASRKTCSDHGETAERQFTMDSNTKKYCRPQQKKEYREREIRTASNHVG